MNYAVIAQRRLRGRRQQSCIALIAETRRVPVARLLMKVSLVVVSVRTLLQKVELMHVQTRERRSEMLMLVFVIR